MALSDQEILSLWKDSSWPGSYTGIKTFKTLLKLDKNIDVSEKRLLKVLKEDSLYLQHLRPIRKLKRRSYNLTFYGELIQADIAYMFTYEEYSYFLVLIDCFSLKSFIKPLKTKNSKEVLSAFVYLLKKFETDIKKVQTDQGTEFVLCKKYCEEHKILFQYKFGLNKANFAEWIIMIVKRRLYKLLRDNLDHNWPKFVASIGDQFNETPQKKLGFLKPVEITNIFDSVKVQNARKLNGLNPFPVETVPYLQQRRNQIEHEKNPDELQVGDFVYLDFNQSLFGKSFDIQVCDTF